MTRKGKRQQHKDAILEALDDPDVVVVHRDGRFTLEENEEEVVEKTPDIDPTDVLHDIFMDMQDYCHREGLELLDKNTAFVNFCALYENKK